MPVIGWDESSPTDTESAGLGDDRIRSLKTSLRQGLDGEHVWPSAGGDAGVHRLGSARAYIGLQSQVSSSGTDGRLMWASDSSQFFHVGSTGTVLVGGPTVMSVGPHGTQVFYPQRSQWVEEIGQGITGPSGSTVVTWGNSGFSGVPFVGHPTQNDPATIGAVAQLYWSAIGATSATVNAVSLVGASALSGAQFYWRSLGTRAL